MNKTLHTYIHKDSVFVFSSVSYTLYGFRGFYAALFLFIQDNPIKNVIYDFIKNSDKHLNDDMYTLVNKMLDLINEVDTQHLKENKDFSLQPLNVNKKDGIECKIEDWSFFLNFKNQAVEKIIKENFKHLFSNSTQTRLSSIAIELKNNFYIISINGTKMKEVASLQHIIPIVQDMIRLLYYHNIDYLIALHSAALEYKGKTLLFPASSGSGKSTLTAYLMHHGFHVFSDELTIIKKDTSIVPLPFPLSIKEGSWNILANFTKEGEELTTHYRFDEQKLYLLPPTQMANNNISSNNAYIIFPTYIKDTEIILTSIDIIEALELMSNIQYHIANYKDVANIESWLNILITCKIYKLSYSNIEEAKKMIKEIMHI